MSGMEQFWGRGGGLVVFGVLSCLKQLHMCFHQHGGEGTRVELSFVGELFL